MARIMNFEKILTTANNYLNISSSSKTAYVITSVGASVDIEDIKVGGSTVSDALPSTYAPLAIPTPDSGYYYDISDMPIIVPNSTNVRIDLSAAGSVRLSGMAIAFDNNEDPEKELPRILGDVYNRVNGQSKVYKIIRTVSGDVAKNTGTTTITVNAGTEANIGSFKLDTSESWTITRIMATASSDADKLGLVINYGPNGSKTYDTLDPNFEGSVQGLTLENLSPYMSNARTILPSPIQLNPTDTISFTIRVNEDISLAANTTLTASVIIEAIKHIH